MSEASPVETRPRPHLTSPIPRHQLGTLSVNQRSYSRVSSKGFYGDESPLLLSPLPLYPRRRSVTFAAAPSVFREERPYYNATHSASAPVSPVAARRGSPPPVSILKSHSSYPGEDDKSRRAMYDDEVGTRGNRGTDAAATGGTHAAPADAATVTGTGAGGTRGTHGHGSPAPQRGRSSSRQRLAARRREAQLHHSFYDDSFVEEFVLNAKSELARQQAEAAAEREQAARQPPSPAPATMTPAARSQSQRGPGTKEAEGEHVGRMSALQRAKKALLAVVQRRCSSVTPPRSTESIAAVDEGRHTARHDSHERGSRHETKETSSTTAATSAAMRRRPKTRHEIRQNASDNKDGDEESDGGQDEMDLVRSLEEDSDPAVQKALQELLHAASADSRQGSRKRPHRHPSLPIVSAGALDTDDDDAADGDDEFGGDDDGDGVERRKRAKLERIVRRLLARRREHKSKRSVVVIDWSDIDSDKDEGDDKARGTTNAVVPTRRRDKSRSVNASHPRSREASTKTTSRSRNVVARPPPPPAPAGCRRAATASRVRETSEVPELSDSILMDGDQDGPILLTRRPRRRPVLVTRSLSHLQDDDNASNDDGENDATPKVESRRREPMSAEDVERVIRKPPRVTRTVTRRAHHHRRVAAHRSNISFANQSTEDDFPTEEPDRADDYELDVEAGSGMTSHVSTRRTSGPRTRRNGGADAAPPSLAAAVTSSTSTDADDPMAVFFQAAFPSPSKFDEMMMHAGGLPETRRNGRRAGHQPNLVLPSSIARRR